MLDIVKFIFQDFKHWLGALILVGAIAQFHLVEVTVNKPPILPNLCNQAQMPSK